MKLSGSDCSNDLIAAHIKVLDARIIVNQRD